ncbi:MAG: peptide chain release factor N(5)-glutamine methyltransferase [Candidatus Zixiibacteriota bacterium]
MPRTITELLNEAAGRLEAAGIESPRLAVELFLRTILDTSPVELAMNPTREVSSADEKLLSDMIGRRLQHEPVQYILGETEWFALAIKCDARALIPRPETEIIVEKALELLKTVGNPRVVDVGTGTGCIAIAIANHRPDARVFATDLSSGALQLAEENVGYHLLEQRIDLRQGDLLSPVYLEQPFELIIANLPYVRESEYPDLMAEVRDYEPRNALVAGGDGLEAIRTLIAEAPELLAPAGYLIMEYGVDHDKPIRDLAAKTEGLKFIKTIIDYNQRERGIILQKI